jgi:hypothetical protein
MLSTDATWKTSSPAGRSNHWSGEISSASLRAPQRASSAACSRGHSVRGQHRSSSQSQRLLRRLQFQRTGCRDRTEGRRLAVRPVGVEELSGVGGPSQGTHWVEVAGDDAFLSVDVVDDDFGASACGSEEREGAVGGQSERLAAGREMLRGRWAGASQRDDVHVVAGRRAPGSSLTAVPSSPCKTHEDRCAHHRRPRADMRVKRRCLARRVSSNLGSPTSQDGQRPPMRRSPSRRHDRARHVLAHGNETRGDRSA